ncbi:MAG: fused MFS/spermidine synthase [Ktedonobacterales bacterium]
MRTIMRKPGGELAGHARAAAPLRAWLATRRLVSPTRLPLLTLVFVGGVVSLSLELCAPRLLAPYFGTTLFVWAIVIGLFLIYLSTGYFVGGRLADRYPSQRTLSALTAVAALWIGLIPFISQPVLEWSVRGLSEVNVGVVATTFFSVVLLFAVPIILLGLVSPFAVRLSVDAVNTSGQSAGSLYALSTVGSILGTFLPVFVLIPNWGVRRTLLGLCLMLLAASIWGLRPRMRLLTGVPGALLLVPVLLPQVAPLGPLKPQPGLIFDQESLYNYIQVVQQADGTRELVLNEGQAIHSVYRPDRILTGWYWDYFLAAPYFNAGADAGRVRRVAIIGLAGGTIARQFTAVYGPVPVDGVEIDPAIVAAGRRYFGMTEPNLHVVVADGRTFMRTTSKTYDVVAIDAFQQPYIPFQLTTLEFFQEVRAHLSRNGVVCLNAGHTRTDFRLIQAFVNTMRQVFPSVYTFNVPDTFNTEIMATVQPTSIATLRANLAAVPPGSLLGTVAQEAVPQARVALAERGGIIFTDDRAPVEQLIDQLLLDYVQEHG